MSTIGFVGSELELLSRGELSPDQVMDSIGMHVEKRLQAERERIAQAIEAIPTEYKHGNDRYPGYVRTEAARIARAES